MILIAGVFFESFNVGGSVRHQGGGTRIWWSLAIIVAE
jgi:hypothetical protein